jgi:hypothetical protein
MAVTKTALPSGKYFARHDWESRPGIQDTPPQAPPALRVAYLLQELADEFRGLRAAAIDDGKPDVLTATKCTLELGLTWTVEGSAGVKFWVLELGAGAKRVSSQKVTIEMSLAAPLPFLARHDSRGRVDPAEAIDWDHEDRSASRQAVSQEDGGSLRLAMMLEKLADEFRRARAGAAKEQAILTYDKVTLELSGGLTVSTDGKAEFWVVDLAASGEREQTQTITVEMEPADTGDLVAGGIQFITPMR